MSKSVEEVNKLTESTYKVSFFYVFFLFINIGGWEHNRCVRPDHGQDRWG